MRSPIEEHERIALDVVRLLLNLRLVFLDPPPPFSFFRDFALYYKAKSQEYEKRGGWV